ncbi:MAG: DUF1631 family protein [Thiohalocapsa sp.]
MIDKKTQQRPGTEPKSDPAALKRMVEHCTAALQRILPPLLDAACQRVEETLHGLADKAESDKLYVGYFEALRLVRQQGASLSRRCLHNISASAILPQSAARGPDSAQDQVTAEPEELKLVQDNDLEETLVLSNMISKAENRYQDQLRSLNRHFAVLSGGRSLKQEEIPISPTAICTAFGSAVKSVSDLELSTLLVIYKVFDKQVMDNLDGVYDACIEFAVSQGMATKRGRYRVMREDSGMRPAAVDDHANTKRMDQRGVAGDRAADDSGSPMQANFASAALQDTDADSESEPKATEAAADADSGAVAGLETGRSESTNRVASRVPSYEQLRLLLREGRREVAIPTGARFVGTDELIAVLSRLQRGIEPDADSTLVPGDLRQRLAGELGVSQGSSRSSADGEGCSLVRADEDTMDLVFLLFEQVLAASDVPDSIKVVISRLQIPYVKIAIMDQRFFDDVDHAARRLINRIAEASLGWNDDRDRGDDGLYGHVVSIVERIVTEFHTDPRLLESLDAEFAAYLRDHLRLARLAELRTVRGLGARGERHAMRRKVKRLIDERLQQETDIPAVVVSIIIEGWVEVMLDAYTRAGENSEAWRHSIGVLDRLIWSILPKRDPAERRALLRGIPELLRDLRSGMSGVISDPQRVGRWLKELQVAHIAVLRGPAGSEAAEPAGTRISALSSDDQPDDSGTDENSVPVGTWIGIMRDDDQWFRVKLAWRSDDGEDLLFVDRLGRKGFEMTKQELETLFGQGIAEIIGDGRPPLMDRAMDAVFQSLSAREA